MTTFEKTWQTDGNRVPQQTTALLQCQYALWYLKAILKNAGLSQGASGGAWSIYYSCDGTTAGSAGDNVDRWTDTFTAASIVYASGAVAHSWMVLKSPAGMTGGPWYLIIDYNGASNTTANFIFCKAAPTGGSTTARPTSTVEIAYSPSQVVQSSLSSMHFHSNLATDGSFMFLTSTDGGARFNFVLMAMPLSNPKSGDAFPLFSACDWNASGTGCMQASNWTNSSNTIIKMRDFLNGSAVTGCIVQPAYAVGNTLVLGAGELATTDASDGNVDDFPAYIYVPTATFKSLRGRLADVILAPQSQAVGSVEPLVSPFQSTIVGNFWMPWVAQAAAPSL